MISKMKGPDNSEWMKVAVTVTNESTKSETFNRRRDHRNSSKDMISGEYHRSKSMRCGGGLKKKCFEVLTYHCFYRMLPW